MPLQEGREPRGWAPTCFQAYYGTDPMKNIRCSPVKMTRELGMTESIPLSILYPLEYTRNSQNYNQLYPLDNRSGQDAADAVIAGVPQGFW